MAFLDQTLQDELIQENLTLKNEFDKILKSGDQNIFYVKDNLLDDEGTVDGVHFTDLGFLRYADYLLKNFKEFMLIN
jgi:hypothetical protein